jgi:hypothetical protein
MSRRPRSAPYLCPWIMVFLVLFSEAMDHDLPPQRQEPLWGTDRPLNTSQKRVFYEQVT